MNRKSANSINPSKSAIQTSYDIVKAHGKDLKVESLPNCKRGRSHDEAGSLFFITLPIKTRKS